LLKERQKLQQSAVSLVAFTAAERGKWSMSDIFLTPTR
jgi:hypothetical protein